MAKLLMERHGRDKVLDHVQERIVDLVEKELYDQLPAWKTIHAAVEHLLRETDADDDVRH